MLYLQHFLWQPQSLKKRYSRWRNHVKPRFWPQTGDPLGFCASLHEGAQAAIWNSSSNGIAHRKFELRSRLFVLVRAAPWVWWPHKCKHDPGTRWPAKELCLFQLNTHCCLFIYYKRWDDDCLGFRGFYLRLRQIPPPQVMMEPLKQVDHPKYQWQTCCHGTSVHCALAMMSSFR